NAAAAALGACTAVAAEPAPAAEALVAGAANRLIVAEDDVRQRHVPRLVYEQGAARPHAAAAAAAAAGKTIGQGYAVDRDVLGLPDDRAGEVPVRFRGGVDTHH